MLARLLQSKRLPLLLAALLMMSASGAAQENFVPTPKHVGREAAPLAGLPDDPKQVRRQACPALVNGELIQQNVAQGKGKGVWRRRQLPVHQ